MDSYGLQLQSVTAPAWQRLHSYGHNNVGTRSTDKEISACTRLGLQPIRRAHATWRQQPIKGRNVFHVHTTCESGTHPVPENRRRPPSRTDVVHSLTLYGSPQLRHHPCTLIVDNYPSFCIAHRFHLILVWLPPVRHSPTYTQISLWEASTTDSSHASHLG